jgi:adenylate cyclase
MKKTHRHKFLFGLLASVILSLLFLGMMERNMLSTLHLKISNFFYFQGENEASGDIVIVAIDDKAFEIANASELGTLTFDKADYAQVIENLEGAGAKVIGVDVILSEATDEEDQAVLASTLEKYDNVILAAEPKTPQTTGLKPLPEFSEARPGNLGAILFEPDKDNVIRRQHLFFEDERASHSFGLQILKKYLDLLDEDGQQFDEGYQLMGFSVRVGNKKYDPILIPTKEDRLLINFFGAPGSFQTISFADVYANRFTERVSGQELDLKDKIVLIGEMGTGLHDEQYVPLSFGQAMPGVEIHANTIQTILSQRFLVNQSDTNRQMTLIGVVVLGMLLFLTLSVGVSVFLFFLGVIAYTVTSWIVFEYGLILNTFYPYLAFFITLVVAYIFRYFTEARALLKTEHAFGRYVSEEVVKKILENPDQLKLGGDQKTLTVFFSDVVNFTGISEKLKPTALVTHLNEYLDRMSQVILNHYGTLDKFVGDAIIAFWGAPIEQPKHAERACLAALDYMEALEKLQKEWKKAKKIPLEARIGIHTGEMIVGNVGSSKRFDYTVIGDAVNLGARLEGANKHFGTRILISGETYRAARSKIEVREIDLITVKGKTKPVRVYELLTKKGKLTKGRKELVKIFADGLKAYRAQKWAEAEKHFKAVLKLDKKDGPSKTYLVRCKELNKAKLPKNWNGVYALSEK